MILLLLLPTSADAVPYAKQAKCFADNLHYEARGESLAGIKAVANVVLNRVKSKRWPNTICQVVYQRKQFSWANYARDRHPTGVAYTTQVMRVVALAMAGRLRDNTQTATHYHTLAVSPSWNKRLVKIKVIGFHVFYRYPFKRKGTEWKHTPKGMLMDIEIN